MVPFKSKRKALGLGIIMAAKLSDFFMIELKSGHQSEI
jgi:hypothetical protein